MADKFDEFSKRLASNHTRRGVMKFFGASVVSAFAATFFSRKASAGLSSGEQLPFFGINQTIDFNSTHDQGSLLRSQQAGFRGGDR